jgi:hypothetical protein
MSLRTLHFVLIASGLASIGCSAVDPSDVNSCTREARAGITVDVRDSVTNALAGRGSRVIAREGAVADTSSDTSISDGPFSLVFERAGTYTVSVTQAGYQPWTKAGVQVTNGSCHVNAVAVTARLQK